MSNHLDCTILANPDVTGIGLRVSIYGQALLGVITVAITLSEGRIAERQARILSDVRRAIVTIFVALLVTMLTQIIVGKLSAFHALIILELCIMNTFVLVAITLSDRSLTKTPLMKIIFTPATLLTSLAGYLLMPALGLYIWTVLPSWQLGWVGNCRQLVSFSLFNQPISLADERLRLTSLVVWAIFAAGGLLVLCLSQAASISRLPGSWTRTDMNHMIQLATHSDNQPLDIIEANKLSTFFLRIGWVPGALIGLAGPAIFILDIEKMISRNSPLLQHEVGESSFGQALAIVLLGIPAWTVVEEVRKWWMGTGRQPSFG